MSEGEPVAAGAGSGLGAGLGSAAALAAALALALALHLALTIAPLWPELRAGELPRFGDHWIHTYRLRADLELDAATGRPDGYDPKILAGYPHGPVDTNSHAARVATWALRAPLGPGRAYVAWVILAMLAAPFGPALCARLAGGSWRDAAAAWVVTTAFLHLDPLPRGMLRTGMVAWPLAAAVLCLFATTFARALDRPDRRRLLACAATLPLLAVHALLPPLVALTFLALLAERARRPARRAAIVGAAAIAGLGLVVNAWWALPLVRSLDQATPGMAFAPRPTQLLRDLASMLYPGLGYFKGTYGLRGCLLAAGALGAAGVTAARGPRARPAALAAWVLAPAGLALAYFGGLLPALARLEPHRLVVVAAFAAAPFALRGAARALGAGGRARRLLVLLAGAALVVSLAVEGVRSARAPLRPYPLSEEEAAALALLRARAGGGGRVLVEQAPLGVLAYAVAHEPGLLALTFRAAGQPNRWAGWDPITGDFLGLRGGFSLEQALQRFALYGVEWLVVREGREGGRLASVLPPALVAERHRFGQIEVIRLARPTGLVSGGPGEVRPTPGRLALSGLSGPVVLRFHYAPGLRALEDEAVRVEPVAIPGVPSGFIRVDPAGRSAVTLTLCD